MLINGVEIKGRLRQNFATWSVIGLSDHVTLIVQYFEAIGGNVHVFPTHSVCCLKSVSLWTVMRMFHLSSPVRYRNENMSFNIKKSTVSCFENWPVRLSTHIGIVRNIVKFRQSVKGV